MKQSDSIANLSKSLVLAQKSIQASVHKNASNDSFASKYADLGAVISACKGALTDANIVVVQSPTASSTNGFVHLTTRLIHSSGEWLEDTCTAPMPQLDPQGFGSAITYLRRYSLAAMMGLYQSDDDGEMAKLEGLRPSDLAVPLADSVAGQNQTSSEVIPAKANSQPRQSAFKPGSPDGETPAMKARTEKWLKIIKTAERDQLVTASANAKVSFTGEFLEKILNAVKVRENELLQPA